MAADPEKLYMDRVREIKSVVRKDAPVRTLLVWWLSSNHHRRLQLSRRLSMVFFIDNLLNVDQLKCVFLHVEVLNN